MAVQIWGHRGCRGPNNPPENSLAAFQEAISQSANGVELDVFLTKDNHLVVFHDDTLERMTNGSGNITDCTLDQLKKLRLKSDGGTGPLTNEQIPTYEEVLDLIERYRTEPKTSRVEDERAKNFVLNTEIKGLGIADHVAEAINERLGEQHGWKPENFQVSSFDMASLREMRKSLPQIPIGALFEGPEEPKAPWDIALPLLHKRLQETKDIQPDTVNITLPSLTDEAIALIKQTGAQPVAWTSGEKNPDNLSKVEQQAIKSRLHDNNIVMITDYPGEMRTAIKANEKSVAAGK